MTDILFGICMVILMMALYKFGFYSGNLRGLEHEKQMLEASHKAQREQLEGLSAELQAMFLQKTQEAVEMCATRAIELIHPSMREGLYLWMRERDKFEREPERIAREKGN